MPRKQHIAALPGWGNAFKVQVGARLRELREQRCISQRDLAIRAGIVPATLCLIEQGLSAPLPHTVAGLAASLDLQVDELRAILGADPAARAPVKRDPGNSA